MKNPRVNSMAPTTLVFTYGTLKKGFSNHTLMEDIMQTGDAQFKGYYRTIKTYPLVCGPYKVPFLLDIPGTSGAHRVSGELYAVSSQGLLRLDELEGIDHGHYERLQINLEAAEEEGATITAEAYFAHRSYAAEMWKRNGKRGFGVYGEREVKGYVKRNERPQNVSFLQQKQIHVFVSSPGN